jgi:iron complex outermembrane recepter protein
MTNRRFKMMLCAGAAMSLAGPAAAAWAGEAAAGRDPAPASKEAAVVQEVVVVSDKVRLLERKPSSAVFGLDKPLIETPRSATFVNATTLSRYGAVNINKLVALSPSTYTASFFGVPGSVNIRGTLAENYFLGFKRIENRGTYTTPIGDAAQLEVLRGPPTPIYGPGKVGGLLNFIPKTARDEGAYLSRPTGEISLIGGSYDKKEVTAQGGLPVSLGAASGGIYGYVDAEDSHSYYRGVHPRRYTGELSANFDLPEGWSSAFSGMAYHSDGDIQTPGWNRLTQDLIDHQTYITGRDATLQDINGDGRLEPGEIGPYPNASSLRLFGGTNAVHTLDVGVGTTKLSPRTVYVSPSDMSRTSTYTGYWNLAKQLSGDDSLKLELFTDFLDNVRFVSYGFPASYQSYAVEGRASYKVSNSLIRDLINTKSIVGLSYRYTDAHRRESSASGVTALDRRDLSYGPTASDVLDSPFTTGDGGQQGLQWETNIRSNIRDAGTFAMTDIAVGSRLNLMVGGRYDLYDISSADTGLLPHEAVSAAAGKGKGSYTLSATYKLPLGLMPYYNYNEAAALEVGQASDIPTSLLVNNGFVSTSHLAEAGLKFQELRNTLVGSVAFYRQDRTQMSQSGGVVTIVGTRATGIEFEVRYLATKNLSFTLSGDSQHTEVKGPDHSFFYLPPSAVGVSPQAGYGGAYVTYNFAALRPGDYAYTLIPHAVISIYANYTSDVHDWGQAGLTVGATHVTKTETIVPIDPVVFPAYWTASLSAFVRRGSYTVALNVDNLFDKLYFTPDTDVYSSVGALPSVGREWRLMLTRSF